MRTTVKLDDDVAAAIELLRQREPLGFSDALNRLARAGAAVVTGGESRLVFSQPTVDLGVTVDVSNIAEVLEVLDSADDC